MANLKKSTAVTPAKKASGGAKKTVVAKTAKGAEKATEKDKYIAQDLLDTLKANKDRCVGLAANMIGYNKAIICISGGIYDFIMINPSITNKKEEYQTEEGCLSLIGERKCKRYKEIEVEYMDINFNKQHGKYNGFIAEIIQHEIDHTNGIII